jgi:hypothetical protein
MQLGVAHVLNFFAPLGRLYNVFPTNCMLVDGAAGAWQNFVIYHSTQKDTTFCSLFFCVSK